MNDFDDTEDYEENAVENLMYRVTQLEKRLADLQELVRDYIGVVPI